MTRPQQPQRPVRSESRSVSSWLRTHTYLFLWLLPLLALTVNPPVPTQVPAPISNSQGQNSSSSLPPEEDHHQAPSQVVVKAGAHRNAKRLSRRSIALPPVFRLPRLRDLYAAPDASVRAALSASFSLKLHRAQLPRRTGPKDGDPALS